ncbi:MAG: hypothetical protein COW48_09550, partial [Hydrogenophilales bacterium CG17_big_fil_post_rev_8_21_14_2_50_63_12]
GEETTLLAELEQGRNQYAAPVVRFAIETAMRQGEILGLRWEDVDLKTRVAVLHDTKNGERRVVPLSSAALSVLKSLPRGIRGGLIFKITQDGLIRAFNLARILHEFA